MGWEEQQAAIKKRSLKLMGAGLARRLLRPDGRRDEQHGRASASRRSTCGHPRAARVERLRFIASYRYAAKKTKKTITVAPPRSRAQLHEQHFCLAIFMALVFFRGLAWRCAAARRVSDPPATALRPASSRLLPAPPLLTAHPAPPAAGTRRRRWAR